MIIGLSGSIGSGKSLTQIKHAIDVANLKQKMLVTNFPVNVRAIYDYAKLKRYRWIQWLCLRGAVIQIPNPNRLDALLIPNSVVLLDEAGVFLNSRDFANTPKALLASLAQSRKDGTDLIWAAQFNEQVDKQFRLLTQYWIHCNGVTMYDKKLKGPKLIWKRVYWFDAPAYNFWLSDPKAYASHFKTRFAYAFKYEGGPLSRTDVAAFRIYDSFSRLDSSAYSCIRTLDRCDLSPSYFQYAGSIDLTVSSSPSFPDDADSSALVHSRTALIRSALSCARIVGVKAPYFKTQTDAQIRQFISTHS